jgi:thiamine-phosphate pyrophosphorylase
MKRYAITNGTVSVSNAGAIAARCAELAEDGVDFLLVREKQLPAGELAVVCRAILAAAGGRTRVLVAQRVDVAIAVGAAGVHLSARAGELTPAQVRRLMHDPFVSVSCHTVAEVRRAAEDGADAVLFGPVFGKTVDGVEVVGGVGLERLREACAMGVPVFALGGVDEATAEQCVVAGASGIAGIRTFFGN